MSDQLARAAQARHDTATGKAEAALRELSIQQQPITFAAVARRAGVSTDFLYRQPGLRSKITSMRSRVVHSIDVDPESSSTSAPVRALSARLKELTGRHRAEVAALRQELAAAQGENLLLRRRLATYEEPDVRC